VVTQLAVIAADTAVFYAARRSDVRNRRVAVRELW
jgi:hypothetical protein